MHLTVVEVRLHICLLVQEPSIDIINHPLLVFGTTVDSPCQRIVEHRVSHLVDSDGVIDESIQSVSFCQFRSTRNIHVLSGLKLPDDETRVNGELTAFAENSPSFLTYGHFFQTKKQVTWNV